MWREVSVLFIFPGSSFFCISVHFSKISFQSYFSLVFEYSSHEEIDVSHPDFFSSAKLNGYIPPNKEVFVLCWNPQAIDILLTKDVALPQKHCFLSVYPWMPLVVGKVVHGKTLLVKDLALSKYQCDILKLHNPLQM